MKLYIRVIIVLLLVIKICFADEQNVLCLPKLQNSDLVYPLEHLPINSNSYFQIVWQLQGLLLDVNSYILFLKWHIECSLMSDSCSKYEQSPDGLNKKGLIVFLHALDHPTGMWKEYIEYMNSYNEYDIWVPVVKSHGNTDIYSALNGLVGPLKSYLTRWPSRPVVLIGSSNGARLALSLEVFFRDFPNKMLIVSISGLFQGTNRLWLRWMFTNSQFYKEYQYQSSDCLQLLSKAREPLRRPELRQHIFYGSGKDVAVVPLNSSYPVLGLREEFLYLPEEGHVSVVNIIKLEVLERAIQWFNDISDLDE